jgi:hypothetical protein
MIMSRALSGLPLAVPCAIKRDHTIAARSSNARSRYRRNGCRVRSFETRSLIALRPGIFSADNPWLIIL